MNEIFVTGDSVANTYHKAMYELWKYYVEKPTEAIVSAPAWNTSRIESSLTMHITDPLNDNMIPKNIIGGPDNIQQYIFEMNNGLLDFSIEEGKENYTYHDRIFRRCTQYNKAIEELRRDEYSTRAVITVLVPEDCYLTDKPCLNHIQFFIRQGKLDMQITIRSNDAYRAGPLNLIGFIHLQKKAAEELGYPVGTYTHRANSFHVYEANWENLKILAKRYEDGKLEGYSISEMEDDMKESIATFMDKFHIADKLLKG